MKIFTNKNIIQKIMIVLIMVMLFNFCAPKPVKAISLDELGGILINALIQGVVTVIDAIEYGIQWFMLGETSDIIQDESPRR